uniref:Threonylcarbamoyl-AMP synthase n=1 Tax=Seriola dumerili TaxID=41447 RepID=A0A3B4TT14_SERDU
YGSSPERELIPYTALGILLLIIAALLAYAGICRSLSYAQLFSSVCLTVSALWCGSGLVYILVGQGVLQPTDLRSSLIPGLAAFTLALLIIGSVALIVKKAVLAVIAIGISLACAHQIAGLAAAGFGQSATAANYLVVCLVGVYFGVGRLLSIITHGKVEPPGTGLKRKAELKTEQNQGCSDAVSVGLVMNLLSASVLACFGSVCQQLLTTLVVWFWLRVYFGVAASLPTFYGFTALLRFAEGLQPLLSFYSIQPFSLVPFPVAFSVLSSSWLCSVVRKACWRGLYQLFFVAHCIAIAATPPRLFPRRHSGCTGSYICSSLPGMLFNYHFQYGLQYHRIPPGQGYFKALVTQDAEIYPREHMIKNCIPLTWVTPKYADADCVLGHACNKILFIVLVLPWVVVGWWVRSKLLCVLSCIRSGVKPSRVQFLVVYGMSGQLSMFLSGSLPSCCLTFYFLFYCFLGQLFNSVGGGANVCPHVPARKATSVQQIAEIMKNGGICGMPTDTVYVLVAACNRPDAVVKAYKVKKQAQDRPMSMWISSIKQLEPVRHLMSPLLLDFMQAAWPSSISMVILRGPWMDTFGLGDAAKHIGTPQSIAIRNPDCAVATHLINLVGPIAVTSANPTGEADTTHHNQVYAKLGDKVDGVLCDGPSPENIASTVVDCTKIDTGHIGFFRVGLIPKSKVLQIFEEVQRRHRQGQTNPAFEPDLHLPDTLQDLRSAEDNTTESGRGSGSSTPATLSPEQSPVLRNGS